MADSGEARIRFGPFEVDLRTHEMWKFGTRLKLVGQPFEILAVLVSRPGELVSRDELRTRLWPGDTFVDFNHGLNAAVNKLREALSDSADNPRYVETLPRRGYRFIAAVEGIEAATAVLDGEVRASLPGASRNPAAEPCASAEDSEAPQVRRWRPYLVASALIVALIVAGILLPKIFSSRGEASENRQLPQRITPLTDLTDTTGQPAFSSDGAYIAFRREGAKPEDSGIFIKRLGSDSLLRLTRSDDDCCPVWSPDGRSIGFSRYARREVGIYVIPATGGEAGRLDTGGVIPKRGELDWSPDGKTLAFDGGAGIFLLSLETFTARRLTEAPPLSEDWGPKFSADGQRVLFVRSRETGLPEEIMAVSAEGGESTVITSERAKILGPPQWSFDGRSVVFASGRSSQPALWRVSAVRRDAAVQINDGGWYPAVSRRGYRLAYQRVARSLNIWQLDVSSRAKQEAQIVVASTSQTDQGPGPQISPDNRKLAYMSDHSGSMEIWVSDRDGKNAIQLTAVGNAGTPRWSPDSQAVVFDARLRDGVGIFAVSLQDGTPRPLVQDQFGNVCPSWSHDGKWIYFASTRSGKWQVWRVPAAGGMPVQLTRDGGHAALESPDGKYVFYAKTLYANPEIWKIPAGGGAETLVSPLIRPFTWASWAVVDEGIVFAGPSRTGGPEISLFDSSTRRVRRLGGLGIPPFWLAATHDGKTVVFDKPGWEQEQIMLVENFR
ncbi:MAG TPA: winged helix-turn-helix domain-containing protein [Terriglobales bacterium]